MLQWKNGRLIGVPSHWRLSPRRSGTGAGQHQLGLVGGHTVSTGEDAPAARGRAACRGLVGSRSPQRPRSRSRSRHATRDARGIAGCWPRRRSPSATRCPLDGIDTGGVSLGFVFCTAAIVLYGWEAGVVVGMAAPIMHLLEHRPPIRVVYNASVMSIAARRRRCDRAAAR